MAEYRAAGHPVFENLTLGIIVANIPLGRFEGWGKTPGATPKQQIPGHGPATTFFGYSA